MVSRGVIDERLTAGFSVCLVGSMFKESPFGSILRIFSFPVRFQNILKSRALPVALRTFGKAILDL